MYELKPFSAVLCVDAVVTSFDVVHPAGFYFAGEMHDFWEAVCVIDGSANATADERIYKLGAGDLLFHEPMEYHRIWADGGEHRVAVFSFTAHGEAMEFFKERLLKLTPRQTDEFIRIGRMLSSVIDGCSDAESNMAKSALESFLLSLYVRGESVPHGDNEGGEFSSIVGVMRENISSSLTVSDIARKCNMSVSTLKKKFAVYSDTGVMKYFNGMKIRRAIDLLQNGDSIKEVASALGFSSINYFHTVFKRETGMTPINYLISRGEAK